MSQRKPVRRRRKKSNAPLIILIVLLCLAIAAAGLAIYFTLRGKDKPKPPVLSATPTPNVEAVLTETAPAETAPADQSPLAGLREGDNGEQGADQENLPSDVHIEVTDLSVNPNLPSEWKNILLLGADDRRREGDSVRTDAIMILSINAETGQVRLSSVLRDLAVD